MKNQRSSSQGRVKVVLSLPRCGTHFVWSRYIHAGQYQLIYDADRIPALSVLADECGEKLDFLYPPPINPNYNFAYNSLYDINRSLTAAEHLERLSAKYSASPGFELFKKIMSLQDTGGRYLLSVNRFVYSISYRYLFKDFEWKIDHASKSLKLLHKWLASSGYDASYAMVIRKIPDWLNSQLVVFGSTRKDWVIKILYETPIILQSCQDLDIPIFWMEDVIRVMNRNKLDFENYLSSLSSDEVKDAWGAPEQYIGLVNEPTVGYSLKNFRVVRFIQYISERDPIKRTSLVRSIGRLPLNVSKYFPILGKRIRDDYNGIVLNNAKLKI
jgi:hypothetical protein